jgi:DNA replication protein DnaC
MDNSKIYKDILRDYDRLRQDAGRLLNKRKEEVYEAIPRIRQIDEELTKTGILITKYALSGNTDAIAEIKAKNLQLTAEKRALFENSSFPMDYLTNIYQCPKCNDTGFVENKKCSCFSQKLIEKFYLISNLHEVLERENFDTFDFSFYSDEKDPHEGLSPRSKMQVIYQKSMEFATDFENKFANLLFYGNVGLGKTFLCNCIAKDVLNKGKTVLYATAGHLFKTIEDARFNRDEMEEPDEQVNFFYTVDLLIIDDLGTEFDTLATQTALFNIINSRILEKRHTIISTNLSVEELEAKYTERLISRIQGSYAFCKFFGDDIRMIKKFYYSGR